MFYLIGTGCERLLRLCGSVIEIMQCRSSAEVGFFLSQQNFKHLSYSIILESRPFTIVYRFSIEQFSKSLASRAFCARLAASATRFRSFRYEELGSCFLLGSLAAVAAWWSAVWVGVGDGARRSSGFLPPYGDRCEDIVFFFFFFFLYVMWLWLW